MPLELSIQGDGLKALQRKLKAIDRKDLRRELNKGLRDGARPLVAEARAAARDDLPTRGGFGERIASLPTTVSITQGGVRIKVKGADARSANRGQIRHPVFGNMENWVTQTIPSGYFTNRMKREAPKVRPDLVKALDRVAEKIARS